MKRTILAVIATFALVSALAFGINAASANQQTTPQGTQPASVPTTAPVVPDSEGHEASAEPFPAGATLCLHTATGDQTVVNGDGTGQALRDGDSITVGPC